MKKTLKIIGIVLGALIILLALSPFLFKGKIEGLLKKSINNNVNAQVEWASVDVSLFRGFPNATAIVNDFIVINNAPFLGDTLASGKRLQIEMGILQLFKNAQQEPIKIDALTLEEARINIVVDNEGNANYDISKEQTEATDTSTNNGDESAPFVFDLNQYVITNSQIEYQDLTTKTFLHLTDFNHTGSGDFSAVSGELDTETTATVAFDFDEVHYFDGHKLRLDAVFAMDLENQKYTFKENSAFINELPLLFNGFVQPLEKGTVIDLTFNTPDSDFKNFLAVIPKNYRSSLDGVETSGDFRVSGLIKGTSTETTIPRLDIEIISSNASFKYPELPKTMNNINIDVKIKNDTGIIENTYVEINQLQFKIDQDLFNVNGTLKNLTGNMLVDLALKGALDLENIEKVYPLNLDTPLKGRLVADVTTAFDMNAVEMHQYQQIKTSGSANLSSFEYTTPELPNPLAISNADVTFNPSTINLNKFTATSGKTDINAAGTIENLIPFVMSKEDLKGRFNVSSKVFNLNDFATTETAAKTATTTTPSSTTPSTVQIPDFLDASLTFSADKVIYDNLELSNTKGTLIIANEQAEIKGLSSGIFGGDAGLSGNVSTKGGAPSFNMLVDLKSIDIDQSFKELDMLKGLAPIAKALQGALDTKINLKGQLDGDFAPILNTISGDAFAQLLTAQVSPEQMPLLNLLDSKLNFINLKDINLDKLKTTLTFKDGNIVVQPFDFDVKGINVNVSGGHSFENEMNYVLNLDVPAKYMGSDVTKLLSKLSDEDQANLSVILPVSLGGTFTAPKVNLDTQAAISSLTTQIVEIQKQKIKDKAGDKINDVLGGLLGNKQTPTDTTATDTTQNKSTPVTTEDAIKGAATNILGGLFGKKKTVKKTTKDTVN